MAVWASAAASGGQAGRRAGRDDAHHHGVHPVSYTHLDVYKRQEPVERRVFLHQLCGVEQRAGGGDLFPPGDDVGLRPLFRDQHLSLIHI